MGSAEAAAALRTITKSISYGLMFGSAYGWQLGLWFGLAGLGVSGPALSFEIGRREVRNTHPFFDALAFGLLRAASFGAASQRFPMHFAVLALDYDGTIAIDGSVADSTA